jgi:hypothetical protein
MKKEYKAPEVEIVKLDTDSAIAVEAKCPWSQWPW